MFGFLLPSEDVQRISGLRTEALCHKAFQCANGNRGIELPAPACGLAGMPAYATADRRERVRGPGIPIGFLIPSLRDERNVPSSLRVDRARLHAREVRFQPFQIDKLGSCRHLAHSRPLNADDYFLTIRSAVVAPPATSTAWVVTLPSSLQVFKVYFPEGTFLIS